MVSDRLAQDYVDHFEAGRQKLDREDHDHGRIVVKRLTTKLIVPESFHQP